MNPILSAALGSILRWLLAMGAGVFVQHGIWTDADAQTYVMAASMALLALGLSLWSKYRGRIAFLTALALPAGTTEQGVKEHVSSGGPTPSVATPADAVPKLRP